MPVQPYRIGDLAALTGVTVRALRHYEAVGLLAPSERTPAGHRLYAADQIGRLQQIVSLRAIGLTLAQVKDALAGGDPLAIVDAHREHVEARIEADTQLARRLRKVADNLQRLVKPTVYDLLPIIQLTTMFEKHYTPDQLARLDKQAAEIGANRLDDVHAEWKRLFEEAAQHMQAERDPAGPEMQALAEHAEKLVGEFTGGADDIRTSLRDAVRSDPAEMYKAWGVPAELGAYYSRAMALNYRARHGLADD